MVENATVDELFLRPRTHSAWKPRPVETALLLKLYEIVKFGPTSGNCSPMRLAFIVSPEAKERLRPCLSKGNVDQTMSAPATAIVAYDSRFYDALPRLFPHADAKSWFTTNEEMARETALRNSSLQGGYLIIAARALGLDCGPMSGFDADRVNDTFFEGSTWRVNFLCNLGYGNPAQLRPRLPRLESSEACRLV